VRLNMVPLPHTDVKVGGSMRILDSH